jgi:ribulose-5-phosphate 4-epimerase/fuculose-1-phosphate aldolase
MTELLPKLTPQQELVLLARALWREGYDDHLAGHITYKQDDGTLLCNPWLLLWEEVRPEDVIRIDLEGNLLEGRWPVPLGIPLHLALHRVRPDVTVAVHNHPRFGTVWADLQQVPTCHDQSSALGGGQLVLVDEYDGPVNDPDSAARQRAVALEQRCRNAWHVAAVGSGRPLPEPARSFFQNHDGNGFAGFWEAMARRELRLDPTLLGPAMPPEDSW